VKILPFSVKSLALRDIFKE